jgi:hypothetical protein
MCHGDDPGTQLQLVASVELTAGTRQQSELYNAIPRRRANRNPYDPNKPLPANFAEKLRAVTSDEPDLKLFLFTDEKDRKKIAEIISQANDVLYADPAVAQGSEEWIGLRWKSVQKYRDGLTVDAFGAAIEPGSGGKNDPGVCAAVLRRRRQGCVS